MIINIIISMHDYHYAIDFYPCEGTHYDYSNSISTRATSILIFIFLDLCKTLLNTSLAIISAAVLTPPPRQNKTRDGGIPPPPKTKRERRIYIPRLGYIPRLDDRVHLINI